jgi:hypothetical protein
MGLQLTLGVCAELRRTNHRYCPTLLVTVDYDHGRSFNFELNVGTQLI